MAPAPVINHNCQLPLTINSNSQQTYALHNYNIKIINIALRPKAKAAKR